MEELGLRGAFRGEWKSETVGIDKTAVPLFFPLSIYRHSCGNGLLPGDLMLLYEACFLAFLVTLALFNSYFEN